MTARNSRNTSNSKNESNNRSANTEWMQAKAENLSIACREATIYIRDDSSTDVNSMQHHRQNQLEKSAIVEKPATCSRDT
jgi:hypothetical protein